MISIMGKEIRQIQKNGNVDPKFIDTAVNFIRTYADQCHHGKEERILFRDLQKKKLKPDDKQIMDELIQEHILGRTLTGQLVEAKNKYIADDRTALVTIISIMQQLVDFYPKHIAKEDKVFFKAAMEYLTKQEKDAMLEEEYEFDKNFIHIIYQDIVAQAEQSFK